jgi:hypothetical protein
MAWLGPQRGLLALVVLAAASAAGGGCAELIGLEDRPVEQAGGQGGAGPAPIRDAETGVMTTEACLDYCDGIAEVCVDELAQYTSRRTCIDSCNALPPGSESEPIGNTLACRARQVEIARRAEPERHCPGAGPASQGECGSSCEGYCSLLEAACPEDFNLLADCEGSCGAFLELGDFSALEDSAGDTLECRIWHASAALEDPETHCEHARFEPASACVDVPPAPPSCERYCRTVGATCTGAQAVYENEAQCLATCAALPLGSDDDEFENTVGARTYHGGEPAAFSPETHCPHASPTGDGVCGDEETGPCDSYCTLLPAACPGVSLSRDACLSDCASFPEQKTYAVATAEERGGLACRMLAVTRALETDDEAHCPGGTLHPCP